MPIRRSLAALVGILRPGPRPRAVRPDTIVAVSPGRTALQLKLPDDVLPGRPSIHDALQVPIIIRQ